MSEQSNARFDELSATARTFDVAIVGAGPVGLVLANFLGLYGIDTVVIERGDALIDYPRGVGMDDECLRVFQAVGLVEAIRTHTTPDQWLRFLTADGRCFASVEPRTREFGWPRRNAFIQPLVDRELLKGIARFDDVEVLFGRTLSHLVEENDSVVLQVEAGQGKVEVIRASYVIGCDGGKSTVRKLLDIPFEGKTESTRWVVIDLRNDPIGIPDAYLFCVPSRPYVSIALPHGVRRLEFMVFGDETEEQLCSPDGVRALLRQVVPHPEAADVIRSRVYTHHARLASRFRKGRVLLAGDAAHLMPVWQGQGYNSGIRDAANIGWKLAAVIKRLASDRLLDTYDAERRDHAAAMIAISVWAGRIFSPPQRSLAWLRDRLMLFLNAIPAVKSYILQMRFKPMPRYVSGAVVHERKGGKIPEASPVGRLFIQPDVHTGDGHVRKLDDAIGNWFAIIAWSIDARAYMDDATLAYWRMLGARIVKIVPAVQMAAPRPQAEEAGLIVLGDRDGVLKEWFGRHRTSLLILRPDRFVAAAAASPQAINALTSALRSAM